MGADKIIDCGVSTEDGRLQLRVPGIPQAKVQLDARAAAIDGQAQMHFRSEIATLGAPGAHDADSLQIPGHLRQVSYLGGGYRCEVDTACGAFFIHHPSALPLGDAVTVRIPASGLHVYPRSPSRT